MVGTGESHSVREFVEKAFAYVGIEIEWKGNGLEEKGVVRSVESKWDHVLKQGDIIIEIDPKYFRPTEVEHLQADITKARQKLGWEPRTTFGELIKIMVDYDMKMVGLEPIGEGIRTCLEKGFCYTNHEYSKEVKL
ncbi:MAG: GDPmannose 4,6-dehydratase [Rikenellaceae bacterium]|nr:GDPmannose 4,6-dehydratase [Rikenellaceae bacterium]